MSGEMLLHWMTHLGEGSWASFRSAMTRLSPPEMDVDARARYLRVTLSDLGHADFFIGGTRRWLVLPPLLGTLATDQNRSILTGGRSPGLVRRLIEQAPEHACTVDILRGDEMPWRVCVAGTPAQATALASALNVIRVGDLPTEFCRRLTPIPVELEQAASEAAPGNWSVSSFDLESRQWLPGLKARSACEFTSRYGERRAYVHVRRGILRRMGRREAVYASAMLQDVRLVDYDPALHLLRTPLAAPLPSAYSRAACSCSGAGAEVESGRLVYRDVSADVAAFLLTAVGQAPHMGHGVQGQG